jgi:hypothetical protein
MASAVRTKAHDEIRRWVEERGAIPTVVKGTEGLLRIDFIKGPQSHGREAKLEEVDWDRWFEVFDESKLTFLYSPEPESRFFKLVRAQPEEKPKQAKAPARKPARTDRKERTVVLVTKEDRGWAVALADEDEVAQHHPTKAEAVRHARELAHMHEPSELVIERVDGEEEHIEYGVPGSPGH